MMRTKHLFASAMALPLLFAACTQDEFLSDSSISSALSNRKTVENVVINLNEPATRMEFNGGYQWVAGDQFGACLMDTYEDKSEENNWWEDFNLVDYIQTNYPFTRQESGNWTSEAVMQEGNYFFYYPYNYNLGGKRTPIQLEIPTEQVLADGEDAGSVLGNQIFLGYQRIVAEEGKEKESISLTLEPILAFPGFEIKTTGNEYTVYRIALTANNAEKWLGDYYEIKPQTASFDEKTFEEKDKDEQRAEILKLAQAPTNKSGVSKITLSFGENGRKINGTNALTAYIMVPPTKKGEGAVTLTNPVLEIYTDKGLVKVDLSTEHKDAGDGTTNVTNDGTLTTITYNDKKFIRVSFDDTAVGVPDNMAVSSTTDLENLVSWGSQSNEATMTANVSGDKVEISKAVYDMLNANEKLTLNIVGASTEAKTDTVTIPADAPANALDRVNFKDINVVNNADVELSEDLNRKMSEDVEGAPSTITNNATITMTGNTYTLKNVEIINKGTITFANANTNAATKPAALTWGTAEETKAIENYGDIEFTTNTEVGGKGVSGGIENYKNVTVNEGVTISGRIINHADDVENIGKVMVNGTWNGAITNNDGTITVGATGAISGDQTYFTNNEKKLTNKEGEVVFTSSIQNSGIIKNVVNHGTIVMGSATAELTTADGSDGTIDNSVESSYVKAQNDETVMIKLENTTITAAALLEKVNATNATRLDISGTITLTGTGAKETTIPVDEVNAIGDLQLTTTANVKLRFAGAEHNCNLNVQKGTTEITANSWVLLRADGNYKAGVVSVAEGAKLRVAAGATLNATPNTESEGDINNYGSINE